MLPTIRKVSIIQKIDFLGNGLRAKFPFTQDLDELRNSKIWGIETYYSIKTGRGTAGSLKSDPDFGRPIISKQQFQGAFLTLYDVKNVAFLINAPFAIFSTIENNALGKDTNIVERDCKSLCGQVIDIQNSFVTFDASSVPVAPESRSIFIDIYYSRIDLDTVIIDKLK